MDGGMSDGRNVGRPDGGTGMADGRNVGSAGITGGGMSEPRGDGSAGMAEE